MTTNIEKLEQEKRILLGDKGTLETGLKRINEDLNRLNLQLRYSKNLIKRIKGKEVQSRLYVIQSSNLGTLRQGMTHNSLEFPLETTAKERALTLKYFPFTSAEEFYRLLGRLEKQEGISKQKFEAPDINFEPDFSMYEYEAFYLDNLLGNPSALRAGMAKTYYQIQEKVYETVKIPGHYVSGIGFDDWQPEENKDNFTGRYKDVWYANYPEFPMAILSAPTSSDLDTLERKLGLVGRRK